MLNFSFLLCFRNKRGENQEPQKAGHTISSSAVNCWDKEHTRWLYEKNISHSTALLSLSSDFIIFKSQERRSLEQMNSNTRWHESLQSLHIWTDICGVFFFHSVGVEEPQQQQQRRETLKWPKWINTVRSTVHAAPLDSSRLEACCSSHRPEVFGPGDWTCDSGQLCISPVWLPLIQTSSPTGPSSAGCCSSAHTAGERDKRGGSVEAKKAKNIPSARNNSQWRRRWKDTRKTTRGRSWKVGGSGRLNIQLFHRDGSVERAVNLQGAESEGGIHGAT